VGIGISGPAAERAQTLLTPLRDLFGGVFFAFFGLSIDPGSIPAALAPALGLAGVGIVTKTTLGWWAAGRAGAGVRARLRAGAMLTARGEFSIVIGALGVSSGAHAQLAPLVAAYVLALAVAGPILTRVADAIGPALIGRAPGRGEAPDARMSRGAEREGNT